MPSRSQAKIRRDINRLKEEVHRNASSHPVLGVLKPRIDATCAEVNARWQDYQQAVTNADRERAERDTTVDTVRQWVQRWRPAVLLLVPGAAENLRALPSGGATADDLLRVAEDLHQYIANNPGAEALRSAALEEVDGQIETARREVSEATAARPAETAAREAYTQASIEANAVLVRGSEVVRAIFGPTSPQYKQFIARATDAEETEASDEAAVGEG